MGQFQVIIPLAEAIRAKGGRLILVGGAVRDLMLGRSDGHDLDVEIHGLGESDVEAVIAAFGEVDRVGRSFPVWKLKIDGEEIDIALPRAERKTGLARQDFAITFDPHMGFAAAAGRRDFTINAMGIDPITSEVFDPWGGQISLERRELSAPTEAFAEDALRVLRGMRFAGRFEMTMTAETVGLAQMIHEDFSKLSLERIWGEWWGWAKSSTKPSMGLEVLEATGWLAHFPELAALVGVPQDAIWHPEGCAWTHSKHVVDAAAAIAIREGMGELDRGRLVLAALCHDLGKATHTQIREDGRITAYGHPQAGVAPTMSFLRRIGAPEGLIAEIVPLVEEHMAHIGYFTPTISPRAVRALAERLEPATIAQLMGVIEADISGRPPLPGGLPERAREILAISQDEGVMAGKQRAILVGRDMIAAGLVTPGPIIGRAMRAGYEAQVAGEFRDVEGALAWAKAWLESDNG